MEAYNKVKQQSNKNPSGMRLTDFCFFIGRFNRKNYYIPHFGFDK
jgi:hypothetical protein